MAPWCHSYSSSSDFILVLLLVVGVAAPAMGAQVPASKTFTVVNQGDFGDYIVEYDGNYRVIDTPGDVLFNFPFQMCFYNTTPGAFVLALRMGSHRTESLMRWVWEANRGHPVGENATLSFGRDGNLALKEADGRLVWHTNTANKGVTGLSLLPTGNLVLYDKKGNFVWQSFDHPTDTLLVGQSLRTKLVSRASPSDGSDGPYSLVLEPAGLNMYTKNAGGTLLMYGGWGGLGPANSVTFDSSPETDDANAYDLLLVYIPVNTTSAATTPAGRRLLQVRAVGGVYADGSRFVNLARPKYNSTYSFLRLDVDGNLRTFTYNTKVSYGAWEQTFAFFGDLVRECGLPSKCGAFGVCRSGMCVGCPTPKGLLGWSESCAPPKLTPCKKGVGYYKVERVEHFNSPYDQGEGPMKVEECRSKCTADCNCAAFFYTQESSMCLRVPTLNTLIQVDNASHYAFIKI